MPQDLIDENSMLVQVMSMGHKATSRGLKPGFPQGLENLETWYFLETL